MPPTPPYPTLPEISPELVLVDRDMLSTVCDDDPEELVPNLDGDLREAMLRMCDLSDVNPPRIRRRRLVAYAGPVTLWAEAVVLIAAHVPIGTL